MQDFDVEKRRKGTTWRTQVLWGNNMELTLREIGSDGVDWIQLAQDMDTWRLF
jgi:hypothetical protein